MSTFGLTRNLKSPDRNKQFILNIPRMFHVDLKIQDKCDTNECLGTKGKLFSSESSLPNLLSL